MSYGEVLALNIFWSLPIKRNVCFFPPKGRKGYLPKRLRTSGDSGLTGSSPRLDSLSPSTQRDRRTSEESVEHVSLPILLLLLLMLFMLLLNMLLLNMLSFSCSCCPCCYLYCYCTWMIDLCVWLLFEFVIST